MANDDRGSLLQRHLLLAAALCDPRTSKGDCQVLAVISAHADKDTGEAWPGVNRIAKRAGIHRSTVLASVARLQGWDYLEVHRERGRSNVYRLSTGSAHATSEDPEVVAPTLPVQETDQSRPRDGGSSADATGLVAPTLRDQSRPRYPNSAFDLSSSNPKKEHQLPAALSFDEWIEQKPESERQKRLAEEEAKKQAEDEAEESERQVRLRARARSMYLEAKASGNTTVIAMLKATHLDRIADLIEQAAPDAKQ